MAVTVTQAWQHAIVAAKMPSNAFTGEEVRCANDVQSHISNFHLWHWQITAGTNIAVTLALGQDYSMAAGDQNLVLAIAHANLLEGSTEQPDLLVQTSPILPRTSSTGQPISCGQISATQIRLWPAPDASYTFKWQFYKNATVFTANTNSYDCPDHFTDVILEGNIWKLMQLADDDRQQAQYEKFVALLAEQRRREFRTTGRSRV